MWKRKHCPFKKRYSYKSYRLYGNRRITRNDFTDFNKIYDNEILRIVGKIMKKF